MMKAEAAATERPTICAGFIVWGWPAALASEDWVGEEVAVGVGVGETESALTVSVGTGDEMVLKVVVLDWVETTGLDVVADVAAMTVKAVKVGLTASVWPRQMLYASSASRPTDEQEEYKQPRAISPSDHPPAL